MPKRTALSSFTAGKRLTLPVTALAAPVQSAAATSTTGGTGLAATTQYFYVVTALNANGETVKSNEQSVTTGAGATNSNTVSWGAVSGATGYRVYRGTATGVYGGYYQVGAVTSKVDTGAAFDGTTSPPVRNSTGDQVYNPGDAIPNATLKTYRSLGRLLARRIVVPNTEVYVHGRFSTAAKLLKKPKPTNLKSTERANL